MKTNTALVLLITCFAATIITTRTVNAADGGSASPASAVIIGRISNAATNNYLEGAIVTLDGTALSVMTERDGSYRLQAPAGEHMLVASYTGLDTQRITVSVRDGATVVRDIGLTAEIYKMEKFTVAGEREGNALAITLQRQSTGVKNVVSADAFGTLAGNPADLAVRLPGVVGEWTGGDIRYLRIRGLANTLSTVTMDGNRMADAASAGATREYQFQQIGSDSIERIEVTKSPTPDLDADSIGGAVNMVSKSAFDRSGERRLSGSYGLIKHVTDDRDTFHRSWSFSYSEVFGKKLGISLNYGQRAHNSLYDLTTSLWENKVPDPAYIYSFTTTDNRNIRTRWGGGLKIDYKFSDSTRFYVNASLNKHNEHGNSDNAVYSTAQTIATRTGGQLTGTGTIIPEYTANMTEWRPLANSLVTLTSFSTHKRGEAQHYQVGSVHKYKGLTIDYDGYWSRSLADYPANMRLNFISRMAGMRIEKTDEPFFPKVTQVSGPDVTNINSYTENSLTNAIMNGVDKYLGAAINVKKDFNTVVPTYIKAGLRVREQTRDLNDNSKNYTYVGPDGVMGVNPATGRNDDNLAQFVRPHISEDIHGGVYPRVPYPAWPFREDPKSAWDGGGPSMTTVLTQNPQLFREDVTFNATQPLIGAQYFKERINAAYITGNVELGKLTILGGLRVEDTKTTGEGALNYISPAEKARRAAFTGPITDAEAIRRVQAQYESRQTATGDYRKVFPGLHLKYEPVRGLVTRASYATNIGRAAIGTLIPNTTANDDNRTVATSNPGLRPQYANNFDVSAEYYFEPAGLFSAGVFLKEIKDFIFTAGGQAIATGADNGFDGRYAGYALTTQANGGFAKVKGLELNYQQQFTFLPGWMKGLGGFANYTRLQTEGDYGTVGVTRSTSEVAGFTPESGNIGISYIRRPVSIRLNLNHAGRYLQTFNATQARLLYKTARTSVDLKTVYTLSRHFDLYLDVVNLFNEADRAFVFYGERPQTIQKHTPMFYFGVNGRL